MSHFSCPICHRSLQEDENGLFCNRNHHFDRAKSGYVHLLPANRKNSKQPGDNKTMVLARRNFLEKGYYAPLREALGCTVQQVAQEFSDCPVLLDAGCGEGYYTAYLKQSAPQLAVLGLDISKEAVSLAARRTREIEWAVASAFHLPLAENSLGFLVNVFAPFCRSEAERVLRHSGYLFWVIPREKHLWGLKSVLYDRPYENEVKDFDLPGFSLLEERRVESVLRLSSPEEIEALFQMTPYAYKTSVRDHERLLQQSELKTEFSVSILCYRRK